MKILVKLMSNCHPEAPNLKTSNFFYSSFSIIWIKPDSSEKKTSMCQRVSRFVKKSLDRITSKTRTLTAESSKTEILSLKTFLAIQDAIDYLKMNSNVEGLFVVHGVEYLKPKIIHAFQRGDRQALHHLLYPSAEEIARIQETAVTGGPSVDARIALECSSALITYLVDLPKPLLPLRVQRLVLGGNEGIPVENVAQDALGILKQDLAGRHLALATSFMELLNVVIRKSLSSELGGPSIVLFLFPTLFQYCPTDLQSFLNAATIFNEMISLAPRILGPREHPTMDARESTSDTVQSFQSIALPDFLPAYFNTGQEGRRRPRRRSPLRCRLENRDGVPDDFFPIWGSRTPGLLHPVLTGGTL